MIDEMRTTATTAAGIEARLARIEERLGDLHEWMRSEQVASLPGPYRRLFSHLVSRDVDRRYGARIVQAVHQSLGARDVSDNELLSSAIAEINSGITTLTEGLADIPRKKKKKHRPYVLALVGSSGAGKTTTMYKLAVRALLEYGLRVKIISSDTYKIGSVEGVRTIADILNVPVGVAFEASEVERQIEEADVDLVILDTAGRSDRPARRELSGFLRAAKPDRTHLVLSTTMSSRAIQETAALFLGERIDTVVFTKLDEAPSLGAMVSSIEWIGAPVGYLSTGTVIPDDLVPAAEVNIGAWTVEGIPSRDHDPEATHV